MKLSPTERQRRSDQARRMHAEGKLNPARAGAKGGRQRARNASTLAAQLVEENADLIRRELRDALKNGTRAQRLRAIESLLKIGVSAERLDVAVDRSEHEHKSREEMIDALRVQLGGPAGPFIRHLAAEAVHVVDGEAVELPPGPR
jgi:hypothetical protein